MVSRSRREADDVAGVKPPAVRVDKKAIEDNKFLDPAMLMRKRGRARLETDQKTAHPGFRIEAQRQPAQAFDGRAIAVIRAEAFAVRRGYDPLLRLVSRHCSLRPVITR
jgi:hypothetical protein